MAVSDNNPEVTYSTFHCSPHVKTPIATGLTAEQAYQWSSSVELKRGERALVVGSDGGKHTRYAS